MTRCKAHNGKTTQPTAPVYFHFLSVWLAVCAAFPAGFLKAVSHKNFVVMLLHKKKKENNQNPFICIYSGERAAAENGLFATHEHLPPPGDRSDAEGYRSGPNHLDRSQTSHRRNNRDERESTGCTGLHVRCPYSCTLEEGGLRVLTKSLFCLSLVI